MSLPKRDGVHDRYYLIHKPDTSPEVLAEADVCIQDILDGIARENHSAYPTVVRNHNGTPFLPDQLLERYLSKLPLQGFPYGNAIAFCDALRRLVGWKEIAYTLLQYIEKQVRDRYFEVGEREDFFTAFPPCTVRPELRPEDVDEGLLRFACYVSVCYTVYGLSFEYLTTEHMLGNKLQGKYGHLGFKYKKSDKTLTRHSKNFTYMIAFSSFGGNTKDSISIEVCYIINTRLYDPYGYAKPDINTQPLFYSLRDNEIYLDIGNEEKIDNTFEIVCQWMDKLLIPKMNELCASE